MQQATLTTNESTDRFRARATGAPPRQGFVINLDSSTTPVALTPPDHAGLKRFTFFVSRRREEGRERFRLHMGYFESQEEAEKLLDIVREIYPGAWAGLAPGQKLRNTQAAVAAQAGAATVTAATPVAATAVISKPAAPVVASAAPTVTQPSVKLAPAMPALPAMTMSVAAPVAETGASTDDAELALLPDAGRRAAQNDEDEATRALVGVRSAIAALDSGSGSGIHRVPTTIPELKPAVRALRASTLTASKPSAPNPPLLAAVASSSSATPASAPRQLSAEAAVGASSADAALTNQSALNVLEGRGPDATSNSSTMPMPRMALPADDSAPGSAKAYFAVQLMWSVQPIDITQVPQLAIFSAYNVYGAEGNRDGRRWYGLRLGFFTDAVSAKQVAHYVRSEFSTVSVVPVTVRERERARLAVARPSATPQAKSAPAAKSGDDFKFIEDKAPVVPAPTKPAAKTGKGAPGKRAKLRSASQTQARAKTKSMTLEETLEILGAGQLQINNDHVSVNDSAVRHLKLESVKNRKASSRLGRLFERLSERIGT